MTAKELWLHRNDIMVYEDDQEKIRSQINDYKDYVLGNDDALLEMIDEHNRIAEEFEKEVEKATEHLKEKLEEIGNKKEEIQKYSRDILLNDELLKDLTDDYNNIKNKWKSAITKYTVALDKFVDSGELKDV